MSAHYIPHVTQADIDLDHTPLTFGRYRGQTPDEVSEHDPKYLVWMYDTVKNRPTCSKTLRDNCENDVHYENRQNKDKEL